MSEGMGRPSRREGLGAKAAHEVENEMEESCGQCFPHVFPFILTLLAFPIY